MDGIISVAFTVHYSWTTRPVKKKLFIVLYSFGFAIICYVNIAEFISEVDFCSRSNVRLTAS